MTGADPRGHLLALSVRLALRVAEGELAGDVGDVLRRRVGHLVKLLEAGMLSPSAAFADALVVESVRLPPLPEVSA